jgi:acetyl esterase/lipase
MKSWTLGMAAVCLSACAAAQPALEAPAPAGAPEGARAIPLYGQANPGKLSDEMLSASSNEVRNVTYPTMTPVLPRPGTANGSAVIVAPGGGFMFLSMDNEGWRIAQVLADRGVTAFVLKYRLTPTPRDEAAYRKGVMEMIMAAAKSDKDPELPDTGATQDALAALKLVRSRAAEWNIDPRRVGMIGFSAGAITTLKAVTDADKDNDPATLPPDFFGNIYGPMDAIEGPAGAPPMFAALSADDGIFGKENFDIVNSWRKAKRPVELHVYQSGGHGFGLGKPGTTNAMMMPEFLAWLEMQGFLAAKAAP